LGSGKGVDARARDNLLRVTQRAQGPDEGACPAIDFEKGPGAQFAELCAVFAVALGVAAILVGVAIGLFGLWAVV